MLITQTDNEKTIERTSKTSQRNHAIVVEQKDILEPNVADPKTCSFCGKVGHFQIVCQTRLRNQNQNVSNQYSQHSRNRGHQQSYNDQQTNKYQQYKSTNVRQNRYRTNNINQENFNHEEGESNIQQTNRTTISEQEIYVFHVREQGQIPLHQVKVNNTDIDILIDSGSSLNLLDFHTYELIKPKPKLQPSNTKIYGYHANQPLPICGKFHATTSAADYQTDTIFYVIPGKSGSLLSKSTAEELNLLRVGPPSPTIAMNAMNQFHPPPRISLTNTLTFFKAQV